MTHTEKYHVGSKAVLTDHFQTFSANDNGDGFVEGDAYAPGDCGRVVDQAFDAELGSVVVLVRFDDDRDLLSCVPGDGCDIIAG